MDYLTLLKDNELKATPQRIAVLKVLDKHTHPTMDELFADIKDEHPSISLATVYKNVSTLKNAGVVAEVNMPNGKMRYDIYLKPHIHVVCDKCHNIVDVPHSDTLLSYQKEIEKSIGNLVSSLDVVAHVKECHNCLNA